MIPEIRGFMEVDFAAELRELVGDRLCEPIYGGFVVTGRLNLDELPNGGNDRIAALGEMSKTALRLVAHMRGCFSGD